MKYIRNYNFCFSSKYRTFYPLKMNSAILTILIACLLVTFTEAGKWKISGKLSYSGYKGWGGSVGVSFSWRKKRRSPKEQVFDIMMYMVNTNSGSRFRLNPCDFALYDQDDDLAVTMSDFDILFSEMDERGHNLVEQLFMEFDVDNDQKISLMEFEEKRNNVFSKNTCVINAS